MPAMIFNGEAGDHTEYSVDIPRSNFFGTQCVILFIWGIWTGSTSVTDVRGNFWDKITLYTDSNGGGDTARKQELWLGKITHFMHAGDAITVSGYTGSIDYSNMWWFTGNDPEGTSDGFTPINAAFHGDAFSYDDYVGGSAGKTYDVDDAGSPTTSYTSPSTSGLVFGTGNIHGFSFHTIGGIGYMDNSATLYSDITWELNTLVNETVTRHWSFGGDDFDYTEKIYVGYLPVDGAESVDPACEFGAPGHLGPSAGQYNSLVYEIRSIRWHSIPQGVLPAILLGQYKSDVEGIVTGGTPTSSPPNGGPGQLIGSLIAPHRIGGGEIFEEE